ncbi:MAG: type II toxin-antitoxin system RelE/ParE family toxin [Thermotogota bacterium]
MARYRLEIKKSVAKDLRGIPQKHVARILKRIAALADEPRGPDSEKLSSRELYRVRQGSYRILYEIRDANHVVVVVKVAHRSKAYGS